jgi:lysophospholipase L1-like esterase
MKLSRAVFLLTLNGALLTSHGVAANGHGDGRQGQYLALGDSVAFGYITQSGYMYVNPENFVPYTEYLGRMLDLDAVNAACPGETTSGFQSFGGVDNGCRLYRTYFPLHVAYDSTQLDFATDFLGRHRRARLVTIGLGANDVAVLQNECAGAPDPVACITVGLPPVLDLLQLNMEAILAQLRAARFRGTIVVVNYFSRDYSDPVQTGLVELLNQTLSAAAVGEGVVVADVFSAFEAAVAAAGGQTCVAGLLNASPQDQWSCDVHPSQSGQRLIAETVARAYKAARHEGQDHH